MEEIKETIPLQTQPTSEILTQKNPIMPGKITVAPKIMAHPRPVTKKPIQRNTTSLHRKKTVVKSDSFKNKFLRKLSMQTGVCLLIGLIAFSLMKGNGEMAVKVKDAFNHVITEQVDLEELKENSKKMVEFFNEKIFEKEE